MVNIIYFSKTFILFSGNINEDLAFEYGDRATANYGCGATLNNEFWYFGGTGSNIRQVILPKYLWDINSRNHDEPYRSHQLLPTFRGLTQAA